MIIRVFIVDQERTFADALASRLRAEGDICVVAAVSVQSPALRPVVVQDADVMLLDADLQGDAALSLCREIAGRGVVARVVMISYSAEPERIVAAVRAGASGWITKGESLSQLLQVIRGTALGETWLPPAVVSHVLTMLLRDRAQPRDDEPRLAALTPRERQVLACLAEGAARREVAARLNLSANTVRTHLQNLMAKLQVHSTLEAIALTRSELIQAHIPDPKRVNGRPGSGAGAAEFPSVRSISVGRG